jgi:glycosyltransferase involved in cell wall biosynthesis
VRLLAWVEGLDHVCCRYRLRAFEPALHAAGHTLEYYPIDSAWPLRPAAWRALGRADAVIVQRKLLPAWQRFLLRRSAKRLIYDFDDAVFMRDSYAARGPFSRQRLWRFQGLMRQVDAVAAGNSFLASTSQSAGAGQVVTMPTCVDPEAYPLAAHARVDSGVQLVWIGSSSTLAGLERIRPLLQRLGQTWLGLSLKLISDRFIHVPFLPVVPCPWNAKTEARELADADVGISWLPDDDWSRGKCGLKVLQYMAAGLPVVANPVGVHADMVVDGETGFLADSPAEWVEAIGRLVHDRHLRQRLGRAGRRRVETLYGIRAGASRWLDLLEAFHRSKQAA